MIPELDTPHSRLVCLISDFDERKDWDELKALVPQCDLNAWDEDGDTLARRIAKEEATARAEAALTDAPTQTRAARKRS